VFYCLDAKRSLPLYAMLLSAAETPGFTAHENMNVGIGYPVDNDQPSALAQPVEWGKRGPLTAQREMQDTPSSFIGKEEIRFRSGGAHPFSRSLKEEIIPFIETHFRASSKGRGLGGCSSCGTLTLLTRFKETRLFEHYFACKTMVLKKLFEYKAY